MADTLLSALPPPLLRDGLPAYTGRAQPEPGARDAYGPIFPYLPAAGLCEAVNLARTLNRPLLLKGEPGCGKTRLARAVAFELSLPFFAWSVKSTSRARDGIYRYDAVSRLRDAQLAGSNLLDDTERAAIKDPRSYIKPGPLGEAFATGARSVVLIDEIDKADIDFPNDLLVEIEDYSYVIEETGDQVRASVAPIILITSNDEKDLPDAFLRRCVFYYIEFPDRADLIRIVQRRFADAPESLVAQAVDRFSALRKQLVSERGNAGKKVSTSELIDWFEVLRAFPADADLAALDGRLPFPSVLLKSWDDHRLLLSHTKPPS